jgi:hypothetical protein
LNDGSTGGHEAVLRSEINAELVETWNVLVCDIDQRAVNVFGQNDGDRCANVISTLAYAHVDRAAYSLANAADIIISDFDPAVFGERCAKIAPEQVGRYQLEQALANRSTLKN